jgi:hypothetical protein
MKRITDKMRLDALEKDGRLTRWSGRGDFSVQLSISLDCSNGKTVRQAIDAAIRAEARKGGKQ